MNEYTIQLTGGELDKLLLLLTKDGSEEALEVLAAMDCVTRVF